MLRSLLRALDLFQRGLCCVAICVSVAASLTRAHQHRMLPTTQNPPSLHIVIPTIGRKELLRMLDSVGWQLQAHDYMTVVYDGQDVDNTHAAVRARASRMRATVKILRRRSHANKYGEAVRQECKHLAGDFVVFADDDDYFAPDALHTYRATCNDTSTLYIFQMIRLFDGIKLWSVPNITWSNIGSPMGVIPSWLNDLGTWPDKHSGDYDYYASLVPHLTKPPVFVDRVTYIVTSHSLGSLNGSAASVRN